MKHWFNNNYKTLIIAAFLIPIITVAIVSISHVTKWYGISNPVTWSVYLSIGVEIAALSALAAISANMGRKVYFPFAIVTLIQFIGNIFFAYTYININSQEFKDWVDLVSPLTELLGVDPTDLVGNKRFLAFFAGGMLPIISLSFLHMLVKFTEEDRNKESNETQTPEQLKDFVDETTRIHLSENDLKKLEEVLLNPPTPNDNLIKAAQNYNNNVIDLSDEEILNRAQEIQMKKTFERMKKIEEYRESIHGPILPEDEPVGALANSEYREEKERKLQEILDEIDEKERLEKEKQDLLDNTINLFDDENQETMDMFVENVVKNNSEFENGKWVDEEKIKQRDALSEIMKLDQELGLYDENWGGLTNEELIGDDEIITTIEPTAEEESENFSTITPNTENIFQDNEIVPALSDEEVREMFMNEWERRFDTEDNQTETFTDEFISDAIDEFNQEEINDTIPESITLPFDIIPLPTDPINEEIIEEITPISQTNDLTDEKKN